MQKKKEEEASGKICFREDAPFLSRLFYNYAKPLHDAAAKGKMISCDQYGDIPESKRICHYIDKISANMKYYTDKNPKDKYAMFKGILYTHRWSFFTFLFVKSILAFCVEIL